MQRSRRVSHIYMAPTYFLPRLGLSLSSSCLPSLLCPPSISLCPALHLNRSLSCVTLDGWQYALRSPRTAVTRGWASGMPTCYFRGQKEHNHGSPTILFSIPSPFWAPAFLSVEWERDKMVPELLSGADNGILYEFQGAEWPQKHPPCTDGTLSPGSRVHSALCLKCILSRPSSLEEGEG